MIEMTWGQVLNPELNDALNTVMRQPVEYKTALKILSLARELKDEQKKAHEMRGMLQDKYFAKEKNDKGDMILKEKAGMEEALAKAQMEFVETKFTVRSATLTDIELQTAKLSAVQLIALEPLIESKKGRA